MNTKRFRLPAWLASAVAIALTPNTIYAAAPSAAPPQGVAFYISDSGDDARDGTTPTTAWRSISRVNQQAFQPGDRVLFEGGKKFPGTIKLDAGDSGAMAAPVVVSSYGEGRATIESGTADGLKASGARFIKVEGVNFLGAGRNVQAGANNRGILFEGVQHSAIDQVEVRAYQHSGVTIRNSQHIRVTYVYATENGYAGIWCNGASENVYVAYCRAIRNPGFLTSRNHSGNGILFETGPKNSLIEYCEAGYNGGEMGNPNGYNGPVGIWTWDVDNVNIQHCITHHQTSSKGDGGGFDLDGYTRNSYIQHCYSYNNKGSGYLVMSFQKDKGPSNNTIRYCVSENDGEGGVRLYGSDTSGVLIHDNVFYNERTAPIRNAMFGNGHHNVVFKNNLFLTKGKHGFIEEEGDGSKGKMAAITFEDNLYFNYDGAPRWLEHASLEEWRKAGKEMRDGKPVGRYADPLLNDPGQGEKLTDPTKLGDLRAYQPQTSSPNEWEN